MKGVITSGECWCVLACHLPSSSHSSAGSGNGYNKHRFGVCRRGQALLSRTYPAPRNNPIPSPSSCRLA
ncbi:hypothetical protein [Moraxella lacunata]|uniref:hypothetical protein n=1 Tax=Moraxella lacunata TaxID=477 RepID=UPI003EE19178